MLCLLSIENVVRTRSLRLIRLGELQRSGYVHRWIGVHWLDKIIFYAFLWDHLWNLAVRRQLNRTGKALDASRVE